MNETTGGYVRHRDRMVQESVFRDVEDTLIACRWKAGTTRRKVIDPYDAGSGWKIVTTVADDLLKLLQGAEVKIIDYFPEAGGNDDETGQSRKTEPNTFAISTGEAGDAVPVELGSNMEEQPYTFTMAFYAVSDAVALALLNDLRDRYLGRLVRGDYVELYNYNDPSYDESTTAVCHMEVERFGYSLSEDAAIAPHEVHLYFADLVITDVVDPQAAVDASLNAVAVTGSAGIGL